MEENRSPHKKKSRLGLTVGDAGGIGGVVLLGGSLAVAGLLAAFTIIKNKNGRQHSKNGGPNTPSKQKQDESQGLTFVFQSPPTIVQHQNSCRTSHEPSKVAIAVPIDSCELVSTHSLPLGGKRVMTTDGKEENPSSYHQEFFISDDPKQESAASSDGVHSTELALLPLSDVPLLDTPGPENMIKDNFSENLLLVETAEAKKEDEPIVAEKLAVEENSAMQSVEGEEEEEDGDDITIKRVIEKEANDNDSATELVIVIEKEEENDDDGAIKHDIEKEETNDDDSTTKDVIEKEEENDDDIAREQVVVKEENDDVRTTEHVIEKEESSEGILAMEENSSVQSVERKDDEDVKKENESMETENLAPEENLPILLGVEEEEEDDKREDNVREKEEESSEGEPLVEENSPMQSTEEDEDEDEDEEEEDDDDDDYNNNNYDFNIEEHVMEKEEGSSDGTGCSSMESNVEAIWPAEMIEAFSHELKEMNISNQNSGERIANPVKHGSLDFKSGGNIFNDDGNNDGTTENSKTILQKKPVQGLLMANTQTVHLPSRSRRVWLWSVLVVALLLLLLHVHHTTMLDITYPDPVMVP